MFKQTQRSNHKSKLALDNPSSLKKRSGASSNKENVAPKSSAKPSSGAKSVSATGESSIKSLANDGRQKRGSAYTFEGYTGENSSDSLYVELADSIRMDWEEDSIDVLAVLSRVTGGNTIQNVHDDGRQKRQSAYTFEGYTGENSSDSLYVELADSIEMDWEEDESMDVQSVLSRLAGGNAIQNPHDDGRQKRQSAYTFEGYDGEVSSDSLYVELADSVRMDFDYCVRDWEEDEDEEEEEEECSDSFEVKLISSPPRATRAITTSESHNTSLANDTFDLSDYLRNHDAKNILDMSLPAADVGNFSIELEKEDLVPIYLAKCDGPASERLISSVDDSFDVEEELAKGPQDRLMDTSLSSLMNVNIDYSVEFPTGALGRAPHIFVAKYKQDMKRKAALEVKKQAESRIIIPTITVTAPSDGDISFEANGVEELSFVDILDQSHKCHLLDASLHNWNMRFHYDTYMADDEVY